MLAIITGPVNGNNLMPKQKNTWHHNWQFYLPRHPKKQQAIQGDSKKPGEAWYLMNNDQMLSSYKKAQCYASPSWLTINRPAAAAYYPR